MSSSASAPARPLESTSFLEKFLGVFDVKPVFASGFAGALCLLLFSASFMPNGRISRRSRCSRLPPPPRFHGRLVARAFSSRPSQMGIVSSTNPVFSLQAVASAQPLASKTPWPSRSASGSPVIDPTGIALRA